MTLSWRHVQLAKLQDTTDLGVKMTDNSDVSGHYGSEYFAYQRRIGKFGGKANSFKFKKSVKPDDTVIDFGCGGGFLLQNLSCRRRIGIEPNAFARDQIIENGVEHYVSAQAVLAEVGEACADVIISNNALEHTLNPLHEIERLRPLLKRNGIVHFRVPCDNVSFRWKPDDIDFHLYSWSPMNLGNLFVQAGYEIISVKKMISKWPPLYETIQRFVGWNTFNFLCLLWGRVERSWYQVEVVAMRSD